jgi:hypothetical protein
MKKTTQLALLACFFECALLSTTLSAQPIGGTPTTEAQPRVALKVFEVGYLDAWSVAFRKLQQDERIDDAHKKLSNLRVWIGIESETVTFVVRNSLNFIGLNYNDHLPLPIYGIEATIKVRGSDLSLESYFMTGLVGNYPCPPEALRRDGTLYRCGAIVGGAVAKPA